MGQSHILAGGMVVFAFVVITAVMMLDRRVGRVAG
jgi:molybdate transport system permease protein